MGFRRKKYRFRTKPWKHQRRALEKLLRTPRGGALFMQVGTGKTKVYIDYAGCLEQKKGVKRALVLSTKSIVQGVWPKQLRLHLPEDSQLEWELTNFEQTINRDYEDGSYTDNLGYWIEWCQEKPTVLIIDEAHKIKNPTSKTSRAAATLGRECMAVVVGTGTPIAKWHLDLFGIFRAIDPGILGTSWRQFKKLFAKWGGYGGYQFVAPRRRKTLIRQVKPYTFRIRKDQCLDLPPVVHQEVPFDLGSARDAYLDMARDAYVEIQGREIEAENVLVRLRRLAQITSGYIRSEGEDSDLLWLGKGKATALYDLLSGLREQGRSKLVVFASERPELRLAGLVSRKAGFRPIYFHGHTPNRDLAIADFEESSEPVVFVAQQRTGTEGIDLTCASEGIDINVPDSLITWEQMEGRFHRASDRWRRDRHGAWVHEGSGRANRVTIYHLLGEIDGQPTYDHMKFTAMRKKIDLAKAVLDHPEMVYRPDSG